MMTVLFGLFAAGLIWLAKTVGTKLITQKIDQAFRENKAENLNFTHASVTYRYFHYIGQNHVRKSGETRIYEAGVSLTVFNSSTSPRAIRDLTLHCQIIDNVAFAYP